MEIENSSKTEEYTSSTSTEVSTLSAPLLNSPLPGTSIASTCWVVSGATDATIRVYYQESSTDNINQLAYSSGTWTGSTFASSSILANTGLAACSYLPSSGTPSIRVYYQDTSNNIIQSAYDGRWATTTIASCNVATGTALSAIYLPGQEPYLRVYYQDTSNNIVQLSFTDGLGWANIALATSSVLSGTCLGSFTWVPSLATAPSIRVYYENTSDDVVELATTDGLTWTSSTVVSSGVLGSSGIAATTYTPARSSSNFRLYNQDTSYDIDENINSGSGWGSSGLITSGVYNGTRLSATCWLKSDNTPGIYLYYQNTSNDIIQYHFDSGSWTSSTIAS